jgi:alkylation response protein AidB-like acyl-CoA dehydrogenase
LPKREGNDLNRAGASPTEAGRAGFVERARALRPLIERAAPQIERDRKIPRDVLDALHGAELFRMLLPRSCGGAETDVLTFVQAIEEIARGDASTAWCIGQGSGCSTAAAYLTPEAARAVFGDARAVMASGPNMQTAVAVEGGGYRLTGIWMFASGIENASWLGGHCLITEPDGSRRGGPNGAPIEHTLLFPKERAAVTPAWDVIGLRGTGSHTYSVKDLFVPEQYGFTRVGNKDLREAGALYRFMIYHFFAIAFAGVAFGIALASLESFILLARGQTRERGEPLLRESAVVQSQIGLAKARLQAARAFLFETLRDLWASATAGDDFTPEQRVRLRLATTFAVHQAREVVEVAYDAAGETAMFENCPFERRLRDIKTVSQQVQAQLVNYEPVGQHVLGLPAASKYI